MSIEATAIVLVPAADGYAMGFGRDRADNSQTAILTTIL